MICCVRCSIIRGFVQFLCTVTKEFIMLFHDFCSFGVVLQGFLSSFCVQLLKYVHAIT